MQSLQTGKKKLVVEKSRVREVGAAFYAEADAMRPPDGRPFYAEADAMRPPDGRPFYAEADAMRPPDGRHF